MPWYPGNQQPYNEFLSNRITASLAAAQENYANPEAATKQGPNPAPETFRDVISPMLMVRPQLPSSPVQIVQYNNNIVLVNNVPTVKAR
jgi:hypothetical protein